MASVGVTIEGNDRRGLPVSTAADHCAALVNRRIDKERLGIEADNTGMDGSQWSANK